MSVNRVFPLSVLLSLYTYIFNFVNMCSCVSYILIYLLLLNIYILYTLLKFLPLAAKFSISSHFSFFHPLSLFFILDFGSFVNLKPISYWSNIKWVGMWVSGICVYYFCIRFAFFMALLLNLFAYQEGVKDHHVNKITEKILLINFSLIRDHKSPAGKSWIRLGGQYGRCSLLHATSAGWDFLIHNSCFLCLHRFIIKLYFCQKHISGTSLPIAVLFWQRGESQKTST